MQKQLKFIHITKTAGTSIEDVGYKEGFTWGRFHKKYGYWHELFPNKPNSIKSSYNYFTVIRNPYTRIVSEFHDKWYGVGNNTDNFNSTEFNKYVRNKIIHYFNKSYYYNERLGIMGGSYAPQHLYIDNDFDISILRFENINEDFKNLMKVQGFENVELSMHKLKAKKKFSINDFEQITISLINKVYHKDFELFNYEKIKAPEFDFDNLNNSINYGIFYEKAKYRYAYEENNFRDAADLARRALIKDKSIKNFRDFLYLKRKAFFYPKK